MRIGIMLVAVLAALSMLVAGCAVPESAQAKGTLQVLVTDAPPKEEVTSIMVTVESVAVHKAAAEQEQEQSTANSTTTSALESTEGVTSSENTTASQDEESGWLPLDILEGQATFDLLKVKGIEEVLAVTELEAGKYTQIRMTISKVQVKLGDGELRDATLPSGKLKFVRSFNIAAGETTALLFDFDAEKSVNVTGSDKIIVKPVIKLSISKPKAVEAGKGNLKITTPSLPDGAVAEAGALTITTTSLAGGKGDLAYTATLGALGGTLPYSWSITAGNLPSGLTLNSATGVISGIPTEKGNYIFTAQVSDSTTPANTDTQQLRIRISEN